jgi:ribulose-phosphate 3-epimerase
VVPYVDLVSQFTLLSVEPGFQGMPFIEQTYARLQRLKQLLPNAILEVDGGIGKENIAAVAKRGAALLTVGHALFETEHVTANFEALQRAMLG